MQSRDVILAPQSGGFMATLREPIQTAKDRNQILGKPRRDVVKRPRHRDIATVHGRDITRLAVPRADGADARVAAASLSKLPPWLGGGTSAIRDEIAPMTRTSSLVRTTSIPRDPYATAWEAEHIDDLVTQRRLLAQQIAVIEHEHDRVLRKIERKRADKAAAAASS